MLAAYVEAFDADDPLRALLVGERPEPTADPGWSVIEVRATSINHHDIWSLRGVGLSADRLPMILGCDAAGVDADGREVVVHPVIGTAGWRGDELADPGMSLPSERYQGTMAQRLAVPTANLVEKPATLSFAEAACLPTAWLTAYRMLFRQSGLVAGNTVLVQGAGGGPGCGCGSPDATRPSGPMPPNSARTLCSSPVPGFLTGWRPSWTPSERRRGITP
jgi:NADPH:quinone reductase-like Zn-dependent oxidoreductase